MNDTITSIHENLDSLTSSHTTVPVNFDPTLLAPISRIESLSNGPFVGIAIITLVITTLLILSRYKKQHLYILRNFFTIQTRTATYEPETTEWWGNAVLWLNICISYSFYLLIFTSLGLDYTFINDSSLFLTTFCITVLFFVLKWLLFKFLGFTFGNVPLADAYLKAYFTVIAIMGLLFIPLIICIVYIPNGHQEVLLIISYIIVGIAFLLLFIKCIQLFYHKIVSIFYIILYFCTLEIIPLLIIRKAVFYWL